MRMICKECGKRTLTDQEKCPYCGGKLESEKKRFDKKYGEYFYDLAKGRNRRDKDIASNCGFSASKISKVFRGQGMDLYTFAVLCEYFGVNPFTGGKYKSEDAETINEFISCTSKLDTKGLKFITTMIRAYIFGTDNAERYMNERKKSGAGPFPLGSVQHELKQMKNRTLNKDEK